MWVETILAGVAVAFVGGLTLFAVQKPKQYRRIFPYLSAAVYAAFFVAVAYCIGGEMVWGATKTFTGASRIAAEEAKSTVLPDTWSIGVGFVISAIFLNVLRALPAILDDQCDDDQAST